MAFPKQVSIDEQGTLAAGTVALYTSPPGYNTTIQGLTFNSPNANTLTLIINKLNPSSSVPVFSFTLAAQDVVYHDRVYYLKAGESITVTTTAAVTNYRFAGSANFTY